MLFSSRRQFVKMAAFPMLLPSRVWGANDRIQVGLIGTGNRGNLLLDQLPSPGQIVAVADCFLARAEQANAKRQKNWDVYQDYRKILDRKDIDAVIVSTPDHDRVRVAMHACMAGKDVYAEKPLSVYIGEGRALVKAARKYNRVVQVGTQQRSMKMNEISCALVRNGGLGKIKEAHAVNYNSSKPISGLDEEMLPDKLDWDVWQGATALHPYNKKLHLSWMSWWDYSGGEMTNWGCHGLDQVQCALGMDHTGPVELFPLEDGPKGAVAFTYSNGVTVRLDLEDKGEIHGGGRFIGEKGQIDIWRNDFKISAPGVELGLPPQEEIDKWKDSRAKWQAEFHMGSWLECIPSRKEPNADVEIGHRTASLCHLCNITRRLNRKLRWDPEKEQFPDDAEANSAVNRPRRKGYELPEIG
jgi:predicted dehydrogenase